MNQEKLHKIIPGLTGNPNLAEVLQFIDSALLHGESTDTAYTIAGLMSLYNIDELRENKALDELIRIAGGLEIPSTSIAAVADTWQDLYEVREQLARDLAS